MDKSKLARVKGFMKQQLGALDDIEAVLKHDREYLAAHPDEAQVSTGDIATVTTFVATQRAACNALIAIINRHEPNAPTAKPVNVSDPEDAAEHKEPSKPKADKTKKLEKPKPAPPLDDTPDLFGMMEEEADAG